MIFLDVLLDDKARERVCVVRLSDYRILLLFVRLSVLFCGILTQEVVRYVLVHICLFVRYDTVRYRDDEREDRKSVV